MESDSYRFNAVAFDFSAADSDEIAVGINL